MGSPLQTLAQIGSVPISRNNPDRAPALLKEQGNRGLELLSLLRLKNGFYAFESSLHVLPLSDVHGSMDQARWNHPELWRYQYGRMTDGCLFFAEDAFGNQFCIYQQSVCLFDAETGRISVVAETLKKWADRILAGYELLTGFPLAHKWQLRSGLLPLGSRLMPKIPFVLGGGYVLHNLFALNAVSVMRTNGNLATQIRDLPDGTGIKLRVID